MVSNQREEGPTVIVGLALPGGPVSVAYDKGYDDGLAAAAGEVARLRSEVAKLRQGQRLAA